MAMLISECIVKDCLLVSQYFVNRGVFVLPVFFLIQGVFRNPGMIDSTAIPHKTGNGHDFYKKLCECTGLGGGFFECSVHSSMEKTMFVPGVFLRNGPI